MGSIVKRGKTFRAMVRKVGHLPQYKTFGTYKLANEWVADTERDMRESVATDPKIDLVKLIEKYEKEIAPQRKGMAPSHLLSDVPALKRSFAGMKMSDLQGRGLIDWVLKQDNLAPSSCNWHITGLSGILKMCEGYWDVKVPWNDIRKSKSKLFEMGRLALPNERSRRVSDAELVLIYEQLVKKKRWWVKHQDFFEFCLRTSMRVGEVCRLQWADFNEEARTIIIRDRKHPKKKYGNHQLFPLLSTPFEIIKRQPVKGNRIFPRGSIYQSQVFTDAVREAGLRDLVLHDLRHEGISRLFEMGFEIQEVAMFSGHVDWKTLRRYTHLKPESLVAKEHTLLLRHKKEASAQPATVAETAGET